MLLRKDRRGDQISHLFAAHDGFEGSSQGDFGLAEADVSADQTVHDAVGFHVFLDVPDRVQLVVRLFEGEQFFKFFLPGCVL